VADQDPEERKATGFSGHLVLGIATWAGVGLLIWLVVWVIQTYVAQ
jgi:hypothetical protein